MDYFTVINIPFLLLIRLMLLWTSAITSISTDLNLKDSRLDSKQEDIIYPKRHSCQDVNTKLFFLNRTLLSCSEIYKHNEGISDEEEESKFIFYELYSVLFTEVIFIQLQKDDVFLAPGFQIEERFGDLYTTSSVDEKLKDCFYKGHIVNDNTSKATLSICHGLQGIITTDNSDYMISPSKTFNQDNGEHIIYNSQPFHQARMRSDKEKRQTCPTSGKNVARRIRHDYKFNVQNNGNPVKLVNEKRRMRRALSSKRFVETMLVADESMFEFYGKKEVELRRYLLSIMAIVTTLMKDGSIGNYLDVSVVKLVILKKNPHDLNVTSDASTCLKRFCKWQKRQNKPNDNDPEHFDTAILVTRRDLCSVSNKCETLGLAELGSICDPIRSCSVVEDNGLSVAFTIAHEIGHLLNAPHDGEQNECNTRNDQVHIMTPTFSIKYKKWTWSSCSRNFITEFIESSDAVCLLDKPSPKFEHPLPLKLPGELFTRNQQCQLVYGKNSSFCPFVTRCDRIWCKWSRNGRTSCHTNNMPWADGTKCGVSKWCIQGKCKIKEKLEPVHGSWGGWDPYNKCSRPCGGGIKYATRECNAPKPSYNGDYCIGQRHKYKSCNTQTCRPSNTSFRAEQCSAFNGKDLDIPGVPISVTWLPKYTGLSMEDSCKLFCEIKGFGIFYQLASKVIDGTKCRKGSNDICVDGKCRPAGCDNILNSNSKVDQCGVCNGDNSACRIYTGTLKQTNMGYNFVVNVRRGASRLRVIQMSSKSRHDTNFLALLNQKKHYVFNGQWRVSLGRRRYISYGTAVYYSGPNAQNETIWIPGPLKTSVEVMVLSIGPSDNCNIWYSYTYPIQKKQKYKWVVQKYWSKCFPVCKGYQVRDYECQREIDSQVVSNTKCSIRKPSARHRVCNQRCDLIWKPKKSECVPLSTCGSGIQEQKAICTMVFAKSTNEAEKVLKHKDCHKAKIGKQPPKEIPCYVPCTSVRWMYTQWTVCNETCGGGIQSRTATCVDQTSNSTLPDINCNITDKGSLERSCNTHQCPKWHTGAWSGACSVTCGHGVVERLVYCVIDGQTVDQKECYNETRPDQTRPCLMSSCASWKTKAWSKCSKACGAGHQIREIFCETGNGEIVDDQECNAAEKPTNRKKCFEKACELKAKLTHKSPAESNALENVNWLAGAWGDCTRSCGHGYRSRVIACVSNSVIVTENYCDASKKPVKRELCNTFSCPFWRHGAWSKCTTVCGKGTQTRLVLCGFNGAIVGDERCKNVSKPKERRFCNKHKCPIVISNQHGPRAAHQIHSDWQVSEWTPCSSTCGIGMKIRSVTCRNGGKCDENNKPAGHTSCNTGNCPGWNYGQWTLCNTKRGCGTGWQVRLVVCQLEDGQVLANKACDDKFKPANNRTCELKACQQDSKWTTTPWQPCNVPCGDGVQFRYISCEDIDGNSLPESRCRRYQNKPIQQKPCSRSVCPSWHAETWGECDSSCSQKRTVVCKRGDEHVDYSFCTLENKPDEEQECNDENCVRDPTFTWKVGQWSKCGATCGYSLRTREVECISEQGRVVNDTLCRNGMPAMVEQCFEGPCPPKWIEQPWNECSKTCGTGIQSREVYCRGLVGAKLPDSACQMDNKLPITQECSIGKCGDKTRWIIGEWTECSRSCGIGETRRDIQCVNERNHTQPKEQCNMNNMPIIVKVCNIHNCPMRSCRDVQRDLSIKFDGEHTLQVGNDTLIVYCEGMHRNNPKEFITLKSDPRENYSEIYGKRLRDGKTCPNNQKRQIPCLNCIDYTASGVTFFKKIRIDIRRMTIVPEDKTFADRFGRNPPGFASAGDCYSRAKCPQGRFMVNLQGTGISIDANVTWTSRGYHTSQNIRRHKNGQVIYGKCGGYCGMCSPTNRNGLKIRLLR